MHLMLRMMLRTFLGLGAANLAQAAPVDTLRFEPNPLRLDAGVPGDEFGRFVALDGPRYAISAWNHQQAPSLIRGAAYLGHHDGLGWSAPLRFVLGDPGIACHFAQNVALSGNTAVFGSYGRNLACPSIGRVDGVVWNGQSWNPAGPVSLPDAGFGFGASLSISGDRLVVGDPSEERAIIFIRNQGTWIPSQIVSSPMLPSGALFGLGVDIEGDLLVIAAPYVQVNGAAKGAVSIYRRSPPSGEYILEHTEIMPDGGFSPFLAQAGVSTDGTRVVATANGYAFGDRLFTPQPGAVIVYSHDGQGWRRQVVLPSEPEFPGDFGRAVEIQDGHLLVAAPNQGRVRMFALGASGWIETGQVDAPPSSPDRFGSDMALDPDHSRALLGADGAFSAAPGAAFLFETTVASAPDVDITISPSEAPECTDFQPATVQVSWQSDGSSCRVVGPGNLTSWRAAACPLPAGLCPNLTDFRLLPPSGSLTIALSTDPFLTDTGEILSIECHDAAGRRSRTTRPLTTRVPISGDCPAVTHGLAGLLSGDPQPMPDGTWAMRATLSNPGGQNLVPIVRNHGQHGTVHLAIAGNELQIRYAPRPDASGVLADWIEVAVGDGTRAVEAGYGIALPISIHENGFE
jgi:hypothetical protein